MPGIVPVSTAPNTAPVEPAGAVGSFEQHSALTSERKLFDYVAEIQAQSLVNGKAPHLANPAALGGETLRLLQGYFDRANKLYGSSSKKVNMMSENSGQIDKSADQNPLHAGPAHSHLQSAEARGQTSTDAIPAVTDSELSRAAEMMLQVLRFGLEVNFISSSAGSMSKSVNTLIRGQ